MAILHTWVCGYLKYRMPGSLFAHFSEYHPPKRVVIHKTSEFWGTEHPEHNELDGFYEGIDDVFKGCESDFVALRQTGLYLFREGMYPPLRGTYFCVEDEAHFLYTMGFIPYLETYPGSYVPEPWQIVDHHGGSAPKDLFREILALTKMNVNNCSFADGAPITISFSQIGLLTNKWNCANKGA